jgi:hypothetical protein
MLLTQAPNHTMGARASYKSPVRNDFLATVFWVLKSVITNSVFRLPARRTGRPAGDPRLESAPVSEKPVALNRFPPPGLWVLNAAASFADTPTGRSGGQWAGLGRANEPSSDRHGRDLAAWSPRRDVRGRLGASVATPVRRAARLRQVGTAIAGHDVSGTGWQTLGRAMQSITTVVPV